MPLTDLFLAARDQTRDHREAYQANEKGLLWRLSDVFLRTYDLGFTAFGGPPVHFQIQHQRFVEGKNGKAPWVDEQTYQELFAISQALPGPGSTKSLFCMTLIHAGFLPALFFFFIWSLPGAIGMYGLSLGVQRIHETLPGPVYALLSGLNASTVGIIALAAVQLTQKAVKDQLTRILVIGGACAGLCYNALWYFPTLMVIGGITTVIWDCWLRQQIGKWNAKRERRRSNPQRQAEESTETIELPSRTPETEGQDHPSDTVQRRPNTLSQTETPTPQPAPTSDTKSPTQSAASSPTPATDTLSHAIPVKLGLTIIVLFLASFIAILVIRFTLESAPLPLNLFSNMYLAGTIIFGGGPVVIPLLRSYVVDPGWVSPRDFLLGLAIIQAFPGPNFNFSVYLGALALASPNTSTPTVVGALLGFIGIFVPGITLAVGVQSIWRVIRTKPVVVALLRGINATAVGLVFTAVYRLWEIGYLSPGNSAGESLAKEPWWVVVAAVSYAGNAWFGVPAAGAIVAGGILGILWWAAVR